jgi:hypothetical protein
VKEYQNIVVSWGVPCLRISFHIGALVVCPFFCPTERTYEVALPHPARVPLGAVWKGECEAVSDLATPNLKELESCNLGYASSCSRLPRERSFDAVRFGVAHDSGPVISVDVVFEAAHLPVGKWRLEYNAPGNAWISRHPQPRIQKLADCFLQSYLDRRNPTVLP